MDSLFIPFGNLQDFKGQNSNAENNLHKISETITYMDCGYIQIGLKNNCASEKDFVRIDVGCQGLKTIIGSLTAACHKNVNPKAFKLL